MLDDFETAPITDPERALFAFIAKIIENSTLITQQDVDAVLAAGLTEEIVSDAIDVVALFHFYNTWIDAHGVPDMPPEAYLIMGERMAAEGYGKD